MTFANSGDFYIGGSSTPDASTSGIHVEANSNPSSGNPIFTVESSGGSERLRVEHGGDLYTSNDLDVDGGNIYDSGSNFFGGCSSGDYVESINSDGTVNCANDDSGGTSLTGGDGIDPSSISNGNTISVAWGDANDLDSNGNVDWSGADDLDSSGDVTGGAAGSYLSESGGSLDVSDSWIDEGSSDIGGGLSWSSPANEISVSFQDAKGLSQDGYINTGNGLSSNQDGSVDVDWTNADELDSSGSIDPSGIDGGFLDADGGNLTWTGFSARGNASTDLTSDAAYIDYHAGMGIKANIQVDGVEPGDTSRTYDKLTPRIDFTDFNDVSSGGNIDWGNANDLDSSGNIDNPNSVSVSDSFQLPVGTDAY
jgi:hypothetical protein